MTTLTLLLDALIFAGGVVAFAAVMWVIGWIFGFADVDDLPYSGSWRS